MNNTTAAPTKPENISTIIWNTGIIVAAIFAGRPEVSGEELEPVILTTYASQPRAKRKMTFGSYMNVQNVMEMHGMRTITNPWTHELLGYNFADVS